MDGWVVGWLGTELIHPHLFSVITPVNWEYNKKKRREMNMNNDGSGRCMCRWGEINREHLMNSFVFLFL
jgi:hypothetical protein